MTRLQTYELEFDSDERRMLRAACNELVGGGSTRAIQAIAGLGQDPDEWRDRLAAQLDGEAALELDEQGWRQVYGVVNGVIYGLGKAELSTCTGFSTEAWLNLNLRIAVALWGAYPGGAW